MKKLLLGLGTAMITIIPISTVIACGSNNVSNKKEVNVKRDALTKYHLMTPLQYKKMNALGLTKPTSYSPFEISSNTLKLIKELRDMRIAYGRGWAPIGDSVVDAVNDARFIVYMQNKDNSEPRKKFTEIVASSTSMTDDLKHRVDPKKPGAWDLSNKIADTMNNFLTKGDLSSTTGLGFSKNGAINGEFHGAIHAWTSLPEINNMKPIVPTIKDMAWAQYRANQIEYVGDINAKGDDNPHDWASLNSDISHKIEGDGVVAHAPKIIKYEASENIGNYMSIKVDDKLQKNRLSEITTPEAYSLMWGFFLDRNDATGTVGHRGNLLSVINKTFGWSLGLTRYIDSKTKEASYAMNGYYEFGTTPPINKIPKTNKHIDLSWIDGQKGHNYGQFVINNIIYDSLPSDIEKWSHKQILDALNGVTKDNRFIIIGQDGRSGPAYTYSNLNLHDNGNPPASDTQKIFDAIPNAQIALGDVDSTATPTHVYDILGSSTQAEFESK